MSNDARKPFSSGYAILDVTEGRKALEARFGAEPGRDTGVRIPVVVVGTLNYAHGDDDGESIEFTMEVQDVREVGDDDAAVELAAEICALPVLRGLLAAHEASELHATVRALVERHAARGGPGTGA